MPKETCTLLRRTFRISSLEALLLDDLEQRVQLNRARLNSYGVLTEETKTYCECTGHAKARNMKQKGPSHPAGDDPMDIGALGTGKGKSGKGKHSKGKGKGKQGQQGQDKSKDKDKNKDSIECWNYGKRGHCSKDCWSKKNTNEGGSKGKHKPKNATNAHNLDSTKPAYVEPEVEVSGLDMGYLEAHAVEVRECGWIKIGVDTGVGKTAWPQSVTCGRTIPATATSLSAQQLENLSSLASDCTSQVAMIGELISELEVFKRGVYIDGWSCSPCVVTKVTCSTKARMLQINRCMDPEGLHSCVRREQRAQHLHETEGNQD